MATKSFTDLDQSKKLAEIIQKHRKEKWYGRAKIN